MTGEITLRGRVLPIGGLKSKILAAHLSGAKIVILPRKNEKDLRDIPEEIRKSMKLVLVDNMEQVLEAALRRKPKALPVEPPKVIKGDDPIDPSPASRVRRTDFPPTDQPPVVVQGLLTGRTRAWRVAGPERRASSTRTTTRSSACRGPRHRLTSRRPSASSPASTIPTPSPATRTRSGASRTPTRPTRSSPTPTSASATTRSAPTGPRTAGGGRAAIRSVRAARSRAFAGRRRVGPAGRRRRPLRVPHDRRRRRVQRLLPGLLRRRGRPARRRPGPVAAGARPAARRSRTSSAGMGIDGAATSAATGARAAPGRRAGPPEADGRGRRRDHARGGLSTARPGWSTSRASASRSRSRRGADTGTRVRLTGKAPGGGDLYVVVKAHARPGLHAARRRPRARAAADPRGGAARRRGPGPHAQGQGPADGPGRAPRPGARSG